MAKKIIPIVVTAVILIAAVAACVMFFTQEANYEALYTEKTLFGTVEAGDRTLSCYYFLISDGTAVIDFVTEDYKVFQRIELPLQNEYYASLDYEDSFSNFSQFTDMNFDGAKDLYVAGSVTTANLQGMAWLWDSTEDRFVLCEELSRLPCLEVKPEEKRLCSTDYEKDDAESVFYAWEDGKLVQVDSNEAD